MKIWIDVLTPKQLLFFEPIIKKLREKHEVLFTSRSYNEVSELAKIRDLKPIWIGKYGGFQKYNKLESSISRLAKLVVLINKFSPDLTISFCSPEAARISFGLGIKHIAFCDSPHAEAVMKLTIPLIQILLIPWIIPKKSFSKYGIDPDKIIHYKAIDAYVTLKRDSRKNKNLLFNIKKENILIRLEEEQASYASNSKKIIPIIGKIINEFEDANIIILGRYTGQIENFRRLYGNKAKILKMSFDGKFLLENTDIFVGSGGTMTAESALLGIPTISYNAVPNIVENYLVKNNLVIRETNPKKIVKIIKKNLATPKEIFRKRAKNISKKMEDPIQKLVMILDKEF